MRMIRLKKFIPAAILLIGVVIYWVFFQDDSVSDDFVAYKSDLDTTYSTQYGVETVYYQNPEASIPFKSGPIEGTITAVKYSLIRGDVEFLAPYINELNKTFIFLDVETTNTSDEAVNFAFEYGLAKTNTGLEAVTHMLSSLSTTAYEAQQNIDGTAIWVFHPDKNVESITLNIEGAESATGEKLGDDVELVIPFN